MRTAHPTCDRCDAPIAGERSLLHVQSGPLRAHHPAFALCPDCAADLAAFLCSLGPAAGAPRAGRPDHVRPPSPEPATHKA